MPSITNSSTPLTAETALIQNLGPDILYVSDVSPVTSSNGVAVAAGDAVPVQGEEWVYGISAGTSDVRILESAAGFFVQDVEPVVSGQLLCPPSVYAPASQTIKGVTSTTLAAIFSTSINTGSFVAPASGEVLVTATFMAGSGSGTFASFALAAHGTVTPVVGSEQVLNFWTSDVIPITLRFYVSGLTPGNTYNFDLLTAGSTGAVNIYAMAQTGTTPTLSGSGVGGQCIITTQAV